MLDGEFKSSACRRNVASIVMVMQVITLALLYIALQFFPLFCGFAFETLFLSRLLNPSNIACKSITSDTKVKATSTYPQVSHINFQQKSTLWRLIYAQHKSPSN